MAGVAQSGCVDVCFFLQCLLLNVFFPLLTIFFGLLPCSQGLFDVGMGEGC